MSLYGHAAAIAALKEGVASGRMHHAWLLAGPEGVGKGLFARMAALRLVADGAGPPVNTPGLDVPPGHPMRTLWEAGSHPDIALLKRLYRDKTKDFARNIAVDQVRGLSRLLSTAPSFSRWRIVIADAAEDMEAPAANALLKSLEEPPANTLFFLVSHAPSRLLPTIRSRCRLLRFAPLDEPDMRAALSEVLPHAKPAEIDALVATSDGSPGRAMRYAGLDVAGLDRAMAAILRTGDPDNRERSALARSLALKAAQPRYEVLLDRLPARIAAEARTRRGEALAAAVLAWEKARALTGSAVRLSADPQATVYELAGLLASLSNEATQSRR